NGRRIEVERDKVEVERIVRVGHNLQSRRIVQQVDVGGEDTAQIVGRRRLNDRTGARVAHFEQDVELLARCEDVRQKFARKIRLEQPQAMLDQIVHVDD